MTKLKFALPSGAQDLILVSGMIGVLMILFVPISTSLLDLLLLTNFSTALLILAITFYTEKPLEFSTFPSLLLMTTLFRLSLNVSTTRLILQQGNAGEVISSVGKHVVAGNYIIGLVIFFILIVVQYIVVTNGAQRVAEVAARFTLDSLPGKQMSVDADLNIGIIDTEEAKKRRAALERESNFYGAMDGASKFVKGDAVAGIIIIIINIVGGLSIGIFQQGMDWSAALHRYTLLTVGDGIVTQIPSLIIAVSSGIIITRAASDARLGTEVAKQFTTHPKAILIIVIALMGQALIPGIPLLPIALLLALFGGIYWFIKKLEIASETIQDTTDGTKNEDFYSEISNSAFEIKVGAHLHDFFSGDELEIERRINILRKKISSDLGFVLPTLTLSKDTRYKQGEYKIYIHGESSAVGSINSTGLLAINPRGHVTELPGEETKEPTYGLPAKWISPKDRNQAVNLGLTLVEPETVFLTHVQETVRRNAANFVTRVEAEKIITARKAEVGSVIDEILPGQVSYSDVQKVLQGLLSEQVSIKNIPLIIDVLADITRTIKDPEEIVEKCRERLRASICDALVDDQGRLQVITIYPALERKLIYTLVQKDSAQGLTPRELDMFVSRVVKEVEKQIKANVSPVILCAAPLRRHLRKTLRRPLPLIKILAISEIDEKVNISSAGVVAMETAIEA